MTKSVHGEPVDVMTQVLSQADVEARQRVHTIRIPMRCTPPRRIADGRPSRVLPVPWWRRGRKAHRTGGPLLSNDERSEQAPAHPAWPRLPGCPPGLWALVPKTARPTSETFQCHGPGDLTFLQ